jgi:hypothetical protein
MKLRLVAILAGLFVALAGGAGTAGPRTIAVFDFELSDRSASGGIFPADALDRQYLAAATSETRTLLGASGKYQLVDTSGTSADLAELGGLLGCNGCEAALAEGLGAELALVGVIGRVGRTEYTLQILIRDATTGEVVANHFSGLRMGANYAWSRGARSLVRNEVLAAD